MEDMEDSATAWRFDQCQPSPKKNDFPQKQGLSEVLATMSHLDFPEIFSGFYLCKMLGANLRILTAPTISTFALLLLFLFLFLLLLSLSWLWLSLWLWLLLLLMIMMMMILYGRSRWGLRLNIVGLSFSISWEKGGEVIEWVVFGACLGYLWLLQWKMRDWNGHSTSETSEPSSRAFSNGWAWKL